MLRLKPVNPKYLRIAGIVAVCIIVLLLVGGFIIYLKRGALLQKELAAAELKAKKDYNLNVKVGSAGFSGLATVALRDISVVPQNRDTLLTIKKLDIGVKILPLLAGNVKLSDVVLDNGHLNLTDIKKVKNFDFLFNRKKDTTANTSKIDLAELANDLINQFLYKIPDNLDLKDFLLSYTTDTASLKLLTTTATIKNGQLNSTILLDNNAATWHFAGRMHPSDKDIDVSLYADGGKKVEVPMLEKQLKLKFSFDTITTRLSKVEHSDGQTRIYGYWSVSNLLLNNPALAEDNIIVPNMSIDANLFVGSNYVSLDSSSVIHLKKISAHPYIKYTLNPVKIYALKINTGWLNAQDIFDSFPIGTFDSLVGMRVAGKLNYSLNFYLDSSRPDSVQFNSQLDRDGFKILKYGKIDFSSINHVFWHTPYEPGQKVPAFIVGPQNPDFTPLDNIAPDLRNAVMTAEDPSFYYNNGFVEESIRRSIATDFKTKQFTRGGSTITMQLVRNVFLDRDKNLARKVEEILITWMIENNHIVSKNRMLEVYFNIIEWGYHVYGIGAASRYYFDKTPDQLTLGESIYLASIVPDPKAGLYAFLPDGTLRPGLHGYFNLIGGLMASRGLTQPDTNAYGFYTVRLKESLRKQITPADTAKADSLLLQDNTNENTQVAPMQKPPGFFKRLFGKHDTTANAKPVKNTANSNIVDYGNGILIDTAGKTKKQIRQEKRALKKLQKEQQSGGN